MRILLAEHNKETASPVRGDLNELGHEVTVAASGADTLYLAASKAWELLIIDRSALKLDPSLKPAQDGLKRLGDMP